MWSLRAPALAWLLTTEVAALLLAAAAMLPGRFREIAPRDLATGGGLLLLAWLGSEAARRVERLRERYTPTAFHDLLATWSFAAALLLPVALVPVFTVALLVGVRLRIRDITPFKWLFNVAAQVVGTTVAALAYASVAGDAPGATTLSTPGVAVAFVPAVVIGSALVAGVMVLAVPGTSVRVAVGPPLDLALEAATLCLGVLVAVAVLAAPVLAAFALPVLVVLGHVMLVAQLRHAASRDSKTGVANATAWHEHAERELSRAERVGTPLSLLLIDLDHFKSVNDTHGHLAGDDVLRAVAECLVLEVRDYDIVADIGVGRFGGEEFVVLLPAADPAEAHCAAERLRRRVAALSFPPSSPDTPPITVTVSIGVCSYPAAAGGLTELIAGADAALYVAKRAGRDQVADAPPVGGTRG